MDELITNFNDAVSELSVEPRDKMPLLALITAIGYKYEMLSKDFRDCRNELCQRCGSYKTKHLGTCNGCRWEKV